MPEERSSRIEYKWLAMTVVAVGTFMATLDASIVNVSLPTITSSLHTTLPVAEWVVAIYLLVITGLLLTLGRLADLIGRKPIYITGITIFTIGSGFCAFSPAIHWLIAWRGIQAIGAAMIMANGPAILTDAFPSGERGKAMGYLGMVVASGLTAGPAIGGFLVGAAGWPSIFLINLPIGMIGIAFTRKVLRQGAGHWDRQFDIPGALLLLISMSSLTLALSQGPERHWDSYIWMLLGAAAVEGMLFLIRERLAPHPMIELSLFRNRLFAFANASAFINFIATFSVMFLMPFYLSDVLGYPPERMGLILTAVPITLAVVAPISGSLSDRFGSRVLSSVGLLITGAGLFMLSRLGAEVRLPYLVGSLATVGFGSAVFQSPNSSAIMGSAPPRMLGVAAGMLATMRNLGMVTGVAVSGAVYTSRLIHSRTVLSPVEASVAAFREAFLVAAVICAVGVVTSAVRGSGTGMPE